MPGLRVRAQDLVVKAGRLTLIHGLNVVLEPGEFVGVLGPSGCGKSTLLRSLAGLQHVSAGKVSFDGVALAALSQDTREKIGYVPQDDIVHGTLKVERALYYSGRLRGLSGPALQTATEQVLEQLELKERRKVRVDRLSGGQRKRVSIAVELLTQPQLLFLDEPTSGLDPALEEQFMDLCRNLARSGRTVIMSTHVMQSLNRLDLIVVMQSGHVQFVGAPQMALGYFGVTNLTQVYHLFSKQDPLQGAQRFLASPLYTTYVTSRMARP